MGDYEVTVRITIPHSLNREYADIRARRILDKAGREEKYGYSLVSTEKLKDGKRDDNDEPILPAFTKEDVYGMARQQKIPFENIDWRRVGRYMNSYCYEGAYNIWNAIEDALKD